MNFAGVLTVSSKKGLEALSLFSSCLVSGKSSLISYIIAPTSTSICFTYFIPPPSFWAFLLCSFLIPSGKNKERYCQPQKRKEASPRRICSLRRLQVLWTFCATVLAHLSGSPQWTVRETFRESKCWVQRHELRETAGGLAKTEFELFSGKNKRASAPQQRRQKCGKNPCEFTAQQAWSGPQDSAAGCRMWQGKERTSRSTWDWDTRCKSCEFRFHRKTISSLPWVRLPGILKVMS